MSVGQTTPGGFTLIELLVVVAILTAVTFLALDSVSVSVDMRQQRYDDTRLRLETIRRAILGSGPANDAGWDGSWRLSGFVADNGRLPENLKELVTLPMGWQVQAAVTPRYDSMIADGACAQGNTNIPTTPTPPSIFKGHRDTYLSGAFMDAYRDGWGNQSASDDADNFGWQFFPDTPVAGDTTIASLGSDNRPGGSNEWENDLPMILHRSQWSIDPASLRLDIWNESGDLLDAGKLKALLLVYENTAGGGQWWNFSTQASPICPKRTEGSTTPDCELQFSTCSGRLIPQGRHLLALLNDNAIIAYRTIDLFAGAQPPNITLDIR